MPSSTASPLAPDAIELLGTQVLGLPTAADGTAVRAALADRVQTSFGNPQVRAARDEVVASIHQAVLQPGEGRSGPVTIRGADIVLDPTAVITRIAEAVDGRLAAIVGLSGGRLDGAVRRRDDPRHPDLPADDGDARTRSSSRCRSRRWPSRILVVLLAHRRLRALRVVGIVLAFAGLITIVLVWLAGGVPVGHPG